MSRTYQIETRLVNIPKAYIKADDFLIRGGRLILVRPDNSTFEIQAGVWKHIYRDDSHLFVEPSEGSRWIE